MYKLAKFRSGLGARSRATAAARITVIDVQLRMLVSISGVDESERIEALKEERAELQKQLPFLILS